MHELTGKLTLLGNAKLGQTSNQYSLIELDGVIYSNILINQTLDNFLQRALNDPGEVTLWMRGQSIIAIQLSDGKFYATRFWAAPLMECLFATVAILFFGLGILLWMRILFVRLPQQSEFQSLLNRHPGAVVLN